MPASLSVADGGGRLAPDRRAVCLHSRRAAAAAVCLHCRRAASAGSVGGGRLKKNMASCQHFASSARYTTTGVETCGNKHEKAQQNVIVHSSLLPIALSLKLYVAGFVGHKIMKGNYYVKLLYQ